VENLAWLSTDRLFFAITVQGGGQIWWDLVILCPSPLTNLLQEYIFIKFSCSKALIFNNKDSFILSKVFLNIYFLAYSRRWIGKRNWVQNWTEFFFPKETDFPLSTAWLLPPGLGCNLDFVSRSLQPICDKVRLAVCRTLPDYVVSPLLVK